MTTVQTDFGEGKLTIEIGEFAKQSDGSALLRFGDTVVLATAVASKKPREGLDFFPLTIDYQEKAYAAGKIPGGFFKREGRPSEKEVVTSRLIDRPVRPLFPKGFYCDTQGIVSVLSYGQENISDVLGIIGVSTALSISDIPFQGPVGAVKIGLQKGSFVLNPSLQVAEELELILTVAGTQEFIVMVEGEAREVSEEELLQAIDRAHEEIRRICALQKELQERLGRPKRQFEPLQIPPELKQRARSWC